MQSAGRIRSFFVLPAFAGLLVACGGAQTEEPAPPPVAPAAPMPAPEALPAAPAAESTAPAAAPAAPPADAPITVSEGLMTPEAVIHDPDQDVYLVSNINGSPLEVDDNGYIAKISPEGRSPSRVSSTAPRRT